MGVSKKKIKITPHPECSETEEHYRQREKPEKQIGNKINHPEITNQPKTLP